MDPNADYGTPLTQERAEELIKQIASTVLIDPLSAQYKFGALVKHPFKNYSKGEYEYCYKLVFDLNSKNRYGGYTGAKRYLAKIRDDEVHVIFRTDFSGRLIPF